ncbi:MAG TPA: transglutaminase-like domain-containing protein, partial [Polyangiaceae bacterium]
GEFSLDRWNDLPGVSPLPPNVQTSATIAAKAIGVSRAMPPRDVVKKLVGYFRSFVDSKDPPQSTGDVYLDLTLSKKGVCRHRAFAFMITARSLGIPARMIVSETHAWIEIRDAKAWRRIDLGGAGQAVGERKPAVQFQTPQDPFSWPSNANRGEDLAPSGSHASAGGGNGSGGSGSLSSASNPASSSSASSSALPAPSASAAASSTATTLSKPEKDERPGSKISLVLGDVDMRRGAPMKVSGSVTAEGDACPSLVVDILFRDEKHHELAVGSVATDDKGAFTSSIVVPTNVPVGDYDVIAHTVGDARCGAGISN